MGIIKVQKQTAKIRTKWPLVNYLYHSRWKWMETKKSNL